jgi:hypothetical protein
VSVNVDIWRQPGAVVSNQAMRLLRFHPLIHREFGAGGMATVRVISDRGIAFTF